MSYKAFICYRRDDWTFARAIEHKLTEKLRADSVFLDVDDLKPSQDWKQRVEAVMADEPVVLTLITPEWNPRDGFRRKLMRSDDLVRLELEMALSKRLPIVPVHDERAPWPNAKEVPVSLASILDRNKVGISQTRFDYDTGLLADAVAELLDEAEQARKARIKEQAAEAKAKAIAKAEAEQAAQDGEASSKTGRPSGISLPRDWSRPGGRLTPGAIGQSSTPFTFPADTSVRQPFQLSSYRETPEAKREREARLEAQRERIKQARRSAPSFHQRGQYWVSVLVTLALGVAALVGAETATLAVVEMWTTLPDPPLTMAVLLVLTWVVVRSVVSGFAYWSDPEEGAKVFYTRGILGGYTLSIADYEPAGLWGPSRSPPCSPGARPGPSPGCRFTSGSGATA